MWRLGINLLSVLVGGAACSRQLIDKPPDMFFFTANGIPREKLLGLPVDTVPKVEPERPYYQDKLGYAYRFTVDTESLVIWIEYYAGEEGFIRAVSFTYEAPIFRVLMRRYQQWRNFFRSAYGMGTGHVGEEMWILPLGRRVRLSLSPERRYLQVSYAMGDEGRERPSVSARTFE